MRMMIDLKKTTTNRSVMYLESSNQNMIKRDKILVFYISKNRETLSIGENRN